MPDIQGEQVEKYKLTKEHIGFVKKVKTLAKVRQLLEFKGDQLKEEMNNLSDLYKDLEMNMQTLVAPKESTKEFPGMDFPVEETDNNQALPSMY